jgi:hypothetical protein
MVFLRAFMRTVGRWMHATEAHGTWNYACDKIFSLRSVYKSGTYFQANGNLKKMGCSWLASGSAGGKSSQEIPNMGYQSSRRVSI